MVINLVQNGTFHNLNNTMIYSGENINIELTNNTKQSIIEARSKRLGIVDTGNCEQLLKDNNLLPQNEYLYNLNTNIKNSRYNNTDDAEYSSQGIFTSLFDSKGNIVDTSICSDFTIKLPTDNLIQNHKDYEYMKNSTGVDIFNKSDPFFTDICKRYSVNNSDIVLESRYNLYSKEILCNEGCVYNGIDEHAYTICKCSKLPQKKVFNAGRDLIFKLFNMANYRLVACIMNFFDVELISVYGFFAGLILTTLYLTILLLHLNFYNVADLMNNRAKVIMNDLLDINILIDKGAEVSHPDVKQ